MELDGSMWTGLWANLGLAGNDRYEIVWIVAGFGGQVLFGGRLLVQWLVSERRGQSVIPPSFWYLSLVGGTILVVYAVHREDPVFFFGQLGGVFIYIRNLHLISRQRRAASTG
jgi:lipid-A-disaccharide synthase-like uncharacterized protein